MAVLQKVKINNEWVPVSGSNINSGGGTGGGNVYNLPQGVLMALESSPYNFTEEEAAAFKAAVANIADTTFGLYSADSEIGIGTKMTCTYIDIIEEDGATFYILTVLMPYDSNIIPTRYVVGILPTGEVIGGMRA